MITATFNLKCDSCGRINEVMFSNIQCAPEIRILLTSIGWDRFLNGLTLCSECVQSAEHLERVERVVTLAARINDEEPKPKAYKTDEEILIAIREARGVKSRAARNVGLSVPQLFVRCRKMKEKNGGSLPELNGHNGHITIKP